MEGTSSTIVSCDAATSRTYFSEVDTTETTDWKVTVSCSGGASLGSGLYRAIPVEFD